jgi:hypothetical protein
MSNKGFMNAETAQLVIWSFYWQLFNARDRRTAPIKFEDDEHEAEQRLRRKQYKAGLWGGIQRQFDRFFTRKAREEYFEGAAADAIGQARADADLRGKVDPRTGLPMSSSDLASGRAAVSGQRLCFEAIIPAYDLAAAATLWLPPCPPDKSDNSWGKDLRDWQALAYKPKESFCAPCRGKGKKSVEVGKRSSGLIFVSHSPIMRTVPCEDCGGKGSLPGWDDDEVEAVEANAYMIKRQVYDLAREGFFEERPVDEEDTEMNDLNWSDEEGLSIGFRLTYKGFKHMQEVVQKTPEIQQTMRTLELAGHDVRENAPEWARDEFKKGSPIKIEAGGFSAGAGGFNVGS